MSTSQREQRIQEIVLALEKAGRPLLFGELLEALKWPERPLPHDCLTGNLGHAVRKGAVVRRLVKPPSIYEYAANSRPDLAASINAAKKRGPLTPEERAAQRASWVRGEIGMGSDADEADWRAGRAE